jgi:PAS domain S-box-containing protein
MALAQPMPADRGDDDLLAASSEIIELIAASASLDDTLARIAIVVERLAAPALCSILLLDADGAHVRHGAAPSLPPSYTGAIDGVAIGPAAGSCGTAMYRRAPVVVRDIASDPLWVPWRALALEHGLRACWSLPIIDEAGPVLGAFALYHREPREPSPIEWRLVGHMCRLVRLAIIQHRREVALRDSEERFRAFAEASSDWFWEQDAELRFTWASEIPPELGLVHPEGFIGKTRWEVADHGPTPARWAAHKADLEARRPFRDFRFERAAVDGTHRHINVSGHPIFDEQGAFRGYRGTARDITAQVNAQTALIAAKEEAETASRTKSQFLAHMSHELRTPLNAVLGFSEVIRDAVVGPVEPRYRDYAGDIHKAGQHLLNLINDVLDLSKIEVGRLALHDDPVSLADVVATCLRLVSERAREGQLAITEDLPADLPPVRGDALRLKQVVLNVLSNAVKFTPAGGAVRITAARAPDGGITLAVIDTGIGMSAEDIPVALAPFRQVEGALNRRYEGTGLGLPLAKSLVELHDGKLDIESTVGSGTSVFIRLPARRVLEG